MAIEIVTLVQTIAISPVDDIITTPVELDTDSGLYVREIRVFCLKPGGTDDPDTETQQLVFTLRLESVEPNSIAMSVPAGSY
jgi:hypothetical protein